MLNGHIIPLDNEQGMQWVREILEGQSSIDCVEDDGWLLTYCFLRVFNSKTS